MKKLPGLLLFAYCSLFTLVFGALSFMNSTRTNSVATQLFILPLPFFFAISSLNFLKLNKQGKANVVPNLGIGLIGGMIVLVALITIGVININNNTETTKANDVKENAGVVFTEKAYEKKAIKIILNEDQERVEIKKWPDMNSEIVDYAFSENSYFYVVRQDDWYKILLSNNQYGWINGQNALEIE